MNNRINFILWPSKRLQLQADGSQTSSTAASLTLTQLVKSSSMDERRHQLLVFKEAVFSELTDLNKKYLHYQSVSNFIEHFDRIKNEDDKSWVFDSLQTYIAFCRDVDKELNRNDSNSIFMMYLDKLCNYYRYHLGFKMVLGGVTDFLLFGAGFVSLLLLFNLYIALLSIPLFVWYKLKMGKKIKQKEVYGLFY